MTNVLTTVLAISTVKSIGAVIAILAVLGFVWYIAVNIRAGRPEVASEIELAPNRKPYFDDEALEGPRLTRALQAGLLLLAVSAIGLPLYWLGEPSRMEGAVAEFDRVFVSRGSRLFAPTAEGGYDCAGCHGPEGVGGVAPPFTLTNEDDEFVASVTWRAPALNTVLLRYSEEEVRQILVYGRPGTPMPAWGVDGGGPLTTQQIDELIAYLGSIQITAEEARSQVEKGLRDTLGIAAGQPIDYTDPAVGEALFSLGLGDVDVASGGFSCARCHTKGASIVAGSEEPAGADLSEFVGFPPGSGAFGFSLRYPVVPRQFQTLQDLVDFLHEGSVANLLYGQRGQGSGRMPGFGDNPNTEDDATDGMFTREMVEAVAVYEANLHLDGQGDALPGGAEAEPYTYADATTTTTVAASSTTTAEEG
jgi:mono/diheme cytochrome c family protein